MTHDELQEDLASHLRGGGERMVWTNTQLGPVGSPRPDVFTVNKSYSRFRTDCYEIKVSVSDMRHDVTSGKWQSYRKFGHAVWFAFPRGMVPLDLVPKECGIILRGDGWRAARKPVAQVLDTLPRDSWMKLLMTPSKDSQEPKPRHMNEWTAERIAREKWGDVIAEALKDRRYAERRFEDATLKLASQAEELRAEATRRRDQWEAEQRRLAERLTSAQRNLASTLGLPEDSDIGELVNAIRRLNSKLGAHQIDQAIRQLQSLRAILAPETEAA